MVNFLISYAYSRSSYWRKEVLQLRQKLVQLQQALGEDLADAPGKDQEAEQQGRDKLPRGVNQRRR